MKKQCVLLAALIFAFGSPVGFSHTDSGFSAVAQTNGEKVTGVVKDATGEPMIGVSVKVKGTNRGTVTDLDGRYSINAPKGATLVFSYVGYDAMELPAAQASNVMFGENKSNQLDEVVITAEFGVKRIARAVGSSAQNVKATDITESGRTDFISALQGRVSGMNVISSGGAPGASTAVVLRSATSLSGNNQPLYVVDGMPMNNTSFDPSKGLAVADDVSGLATRYMDYASRGNDFNPEDIESMTVLKGAAAAALYGSDASNGAIIITTKKGRNGRAKVSYSNQLSWSKAYGWPKIQSTYTNGAYGATNYYYTNHYGGLYDGSIPYYDNAKAILQTGFMHKHNISVEAGNEKMSIRGSASFFSQDGVIKTTNLKRSNFSLAGRAELTKWLRFEGSMQYVNQKNDKVARGANGPLARAYRWPNVDDMSNYLAEDGRHMRYPNYYTDGDLLNPLFGMYKNLNHDETDRFISAFSLNFTPIEHVYVRAQFGFDVSTSTYENGTHPYYRTYNLTSNDANNSGAYSIVKYNNSDPTMNILAGYNNVFCNEKFSFGVQVGYHQYEKGVTSLASYGSNFQVLEDMYSINNCTPSTVVSKKRSTKRRLQAISGQVEFGYNNMAFLTARFRNDWSSTLPVNNRSFFYPAVEASWVVTELQGLKNLNWLNYLKVRGAIAQVGKDAAPLSINPELEPTGLTGGGFKYGYTGPNPNLKPEMTTSYEVGLEARLWNNRINADFTWFKTHNENQIVENFRMSYGTGFVLNTLNVGTFDTWGWEAHVDVDAVKTRDLTWNIGVNLSHTSSKMTDLPEAVTEYYNPYTWNYGNVRTGTAVGYPITTFSALAVERNDAGQILINPTTGLPIIGSEWKVIGDREPKLRFGITTALRYKNWRLTAMFQGRMHATVYNATMREMMARGFSQQSVDLRINNGSYVFNGVLKDGWENTATPHQNTIAVNWAHYGGTALYNADHESWVQNKINYLRCQEIRLAYIVPDAWLQKVTRGVIQNASIYVSGNDLFTITNYTGIDVAGNTMSAAAGGTGGEGYDYWSLPSPRTYSFGLSVTF